MITSESGARVILTILRFVQGIGVGGEWGGSVLLSMEWAQSNQHRGFIASWPQFGVPAGLFLSNLAVLAVSAVSGDQFLTWGWRVPFLFSIVLIAIGLYIRLGILETPVFRRLVAERRIERLRSSKSPPSTPRDYSHRALPHGRASALLSLHRIRFRLRNRRAASPARLSAHGGARRRDALLRLHSLFGHLSDRFGRKRIYMLGAALTGVYGFAYFAMLDTGLHFW